MDPQRHTQSVFQVAGSTQKPHSDAPGQHLGTTAYDYHPFRSHGRQRQRLVFEQATLHIVLDHGDAEHLADSQNLPLALVSHSGTDRIVQLRHQVQRSRPIPLAGGAQFVGQHALGIHRQTDVTQVQIAGCENETAIGQSVAQHRITAAAQGGQRGEQAVLPTTAQQYIVGSAIDAIFRQPTAGRLPVPFQTGFRSIAQQFLQSTRLAHDGFKGMPDVAMLPDIQWQGESEIADRGLWLGNPERLGVGFPTDIGTRADPGVQQATAFGFGIGPGDGADRHPESIGQCPLSR